MSLRIIREGLLDTFQDAGRKGRQHLGINPGGAMDPFSSRLANALLGKPLDAPVLEMHFPAAQIMFEKPTIISLCGADFVPLINQQPIPMHHPIAVNENSLLEFRHMKSGSRLYMAILHEPDLENWAGSYSTQLAIEAGGYKGRALKRYDEVLFKNNLRLKQFLGDQEFQVLPWKAMETIEDINLLQCIMGSDWHALHGNSKENFLHHWFQVSLESDRMGYRINGPALELQESEPLLSAGVNFGSIQLLPCGKMIILMADHQTTGGYPRIAHVIAAHWPLLGQKKPGDAIRFEFTDLETAEQKFRKQQKYLEEIGIACKFRMENYLND